MPGKAAPSMLSIFRNRSFTLLWAGQLISSMGSAFTTLAASILVYRITGSAFSVGLMLIATAGPTILIGLIAGVIVDRYDRKRIMLVSELLRPLLILLIPILIPLNINWLYVIVALTGAARTVNIITEEENEFLIIPSRVIRQLAKQYDGLRQVFYTMMAQRLSRVELPHRISLDQGLLRELRTNLPVVDEE